MPTTRGNKIPLFNAAKYLMPVLTPPPSLEEDLRGVSDNVHPIPPAKCQTYGEKIVASASTLDVLAQASSLPESIASSACFRPTALWMSTVSSLLVAHRAWQGGSLRRCANDAFLGGLATAGYQWYSCRTAEHDNRLTVKAYMQSQNSFKYKASDEGDEALNSPAWRKRVERLVPLEKNKGQ